MRKKEIKLSKSSWTTSELLGIIIGAWVGK